MNVKRKAGQPKKDDAKQKITFRLHPEVIEKIKQQPNQSQYLEKLVLACQK